MSDKRWFDDWRLTMRRPMGIASDFTIMVELPHDRDVELTVADGDEAKYALNLLDKLLCELTDTKGAKLVNDERDTVRTT